MTDLSDFGHGVDPDDPPDRADAATIDEQCIALTADGERCSNAVSHMTDDPFCSPHARADDVEVIDEA